MAVIDQVQAFSGVAVPGLAVPPRSVLLMGIQYSIASYGSVHLANTILGKTVAADLTFGHV